jgi:hypothetical protein
LTEFSKVYSGRRRGEERVFEAFMRPGGDRIEATSGKNRTKGKKGFSVRMNGMLRLRGLARFTFFEDFKNALLRSKPLL